MLIRIPKGSVHGVDIPVIESERLADPEAGRRDQAIQGRAGRTTQSRPRGQCCCSDHDLLDLRLAVDPWSWAYAAPWDQSLGRDFVTVDDPSRFDLPQCAQVGFEGVYTDFAGLPMRNITFKDVLPAGDANEVRGSDPPFCGRDG